MKAVVFAMVMAVSFNAFASGNESDKQELQKLLKQTQSLSAEFEQQVKDEQGEVLQTLSGTLKLKRPASLYWHTKTPDESVMVADGNKVWYYNPFVEQVTIYAQQDMVDDSPLLLVLDSNGNQWQNYRVIADNNRYFVEHETNGSQLELAFAGGKLTEITLVQAQGERTELLLSNVVLNETISDEQFVFEVPDGVDVDDQS
ncbi:outer membrane lipoprotein chaperone LolA [Idiomarina ramblicola]|uniref:Outer-membrane lipoprotein carrier protein n=1 Tax=Idiomarina ramblicola TaxID=263724 RepID=A0A432Z503_9GAMM|nr:outer membrane lipoprotein chaperone LolA [Idiomarina ramblicola]RUO72935.1 outer membrane lipoprotein carrier protein LolA [Idiomarina ramblicola]